jgi:hypothetical protein
MPGRGQAEMLLHRRKKIESLLPLCPVVNLVDKVSKKQTNKKTPY